MKEINIRWFLLNKERDRDLGYIHTYVNMTLDIWYVIVLHDNLHITSYLGHVHGSYIRMCGAQKALMHGEDQPNSSSCA